MVFVAFLLLSTGAQAKNGEGPEGFCAQYPASSFCASSQVGCIMCHDSGGPPSFNPYGEAIRANLASESTFESGLPAALVAIEDLDSDGDGTTNYNEIMQATWPGFSVDIEEECASQIPVNNPYYSLGTYDPRFAYKRVMTDFCGRSPRYDEVRAFNQTEDQTALLHDTLDICLKSPYWHEVLRELSLPVVRPIFSAQDCVGDLYSFGNPLKWDTNLYAYVMSGDRDAGDVMTAQYLVVEEPTGSGILTPIDDPRDACEAIANPIEREHRYGVIATRNTLVFNVMFSRVPRTMVAHIYRELLGLDIARGEGLHGIDETGGAYPWDAPLDVDDKGVWQEECAACHSTLDPLSYPWARYKGLFTTTPISYDPTWNLDIMPTTDGYIFGEPIDGPEQWVDEAVNSDAFAQQTARTFWHYLLHRYPLSCEADEFEQLWQHFRDNGRQVERDLLHPLIDLNAYGAP